MLVRRHGEAGRGMPQSLADHLDGYSGLKKQRGMGVTKVMKTDAWQARLAHEPLEGIREDLRMDRRYVFMAKDVALRFGVWTTNCPKYIHCALVEVDRSP